MVPLYPLRVEIGAEPRSGRNFELPFVDLQRGSLAFEPYVRPQLLILVMNAGVRDGTHKLNVVKVSL